MLAVLLLLALLLAAEGRKGAESRGDLVLTMRNSESSRGNGFDIPERDAVDFLKKFNAELIKRNKLIIQEKFKLMSETAHGFFRATAVLFYKDIAPISLLQDCPVGTLHGDLHLENMLARLNGKGVPSFELSDFDESFEGPIFWDVARIITSTMLSIREYGEKIDQAEADKLIEGFLDEYTRQLPKQDKALLARSIPVDQLGEKAQKAVAELRDVTQASFVAEQTVGQKQFKLGDEYKKTEPRVIEAVKAAIKQYASAQKTYKEDIFKIRDIAERWAGVGSLGRHRFNVLAEGGPTGSIILEIKEAIEPAALSFYKGKKQGNNAQRIVDAWNYFYPDVDPFLGATKLLGVDAFVREISPRGKVKLKKINKKKEFENHLATVALVCARAHARSNKAAAIVTATTKHKKALVAFAKVYADLAERDFQHFKSHSELNL